MNNYQEQEQVGNEQVQLSSKQYWYDTVTGKRTIRTELAELREAEHEVVKLNRAEGRLEFVISSYQQEGYQLHLTCLPGYPEFAPHFKGCKAGKK